MLTIEAKLLGLLVLAYLLLFFWTQVLQRQTFITGPAVFVVFQTPAVLTVVWVADYEEGFDVAWVASVLVGFAAFIVGAWVASKATRFRSRDEVAAMRAEPLRNDLANSTSIIILGATVLVAIMAGALFARAIGYSTLGSGLSQLASTGTVDQAAISQLRRGATQETYAAAGYALQFTAALLPVLLIAAYVRGVSTSRPAWKYAALALAPVNVYFLSILGGRQYLFGAALVTAFLLSSATSPLPRNVGKGALKSGLLLVFAIALFGLTTVLQGRASGSGPLGLLAQSVVSIANRVGGDATEYQFEAMRLLRGEGPVYGDHWIGQLSIVLPGRTEGISFDERLHGLIFVGNTGGNQPLDLWGATYYNWGFVGMLVVPALYGYGLQRFTVSRIVRGDRRLLGTVVLTAASYNLALASDPYQLILQGGLTLILFDKLFSMSSPPLTPREPKEPVDVGRPARSPRRPVVAVKVDVV